MRIVKRVAAVALLLYVGVTVGVLIAQEVSTQQRVASADASATGVETAGPPTAEDAGNTDAAAEIPMTDEPEGTEADGEAELPESATAAAVDDGAASLDCVVDAIYFHNTMRCHTCRLIEETAKAVIEAEFSSEMAAGQLRCSAIDMQLERRYVDLYDLSRPTLALVRTVDGEVTDWVALDETWSLIRSKPRFEMYIRDRVHDFLGGCS